MYGYIVKVVSSIQVSRRKPMLAICQYHIHLLGQSNNVKITKLLIEMSGTAPIYVLQLRV
jgi:hypothetical protein